MDFGCRWSSGNNHSLRGRVRCVVLIASYREARVRGLALKKEAFEAEYSRVHGVGCSFIRSDQIRS